MKCRAYPFLGLFLGALALGGCDNAGPQLPPSPGGEAARAEMEHPFGPPKNVKNVSPKKSTQNAEDKPKPVH